MPRSGSQSKASPKTEEYFIWVSGLPAQWTWQNLKDYVRNAITNQPKWTEVLQARPGTQEGYFKVVGREDADLAYNCFADPSVNVNNLMLVHEWQLARDGTPPALIRCNCSSRHSDIRPGQHSTRSGIDMSVITRTISIASLPVSAAPGYSYTYDGYTTFPAYTTQTAQYTQYYTTPAMPVNAVQRRAVMPQPAYPMTASGIPVNGTDGLLRTESRGIHIKGLNYMCTERDLQGLLSSYGGHPTSIVLPREGRSAKCKGWATAEFATKEEAQIAVSRLNQAQHMGKVISVRHDKDAASVQGPVIANGSTIKM